MSALEGNNDTSSGVLPSEAGNAPASITAARVLCVQSFNRLTELLRDSDRSRNSAPYISAIAIDGEFDRFKLWEANIRDVQHGFRAPSERRKAIVKDHVIMLLRHLNGFLTDCQYHFTFL